MNFGEIILLRARWLLLSGQVLRYGEAKKFARHVHQKFMPPQATAKTKESKSLVQSKSKREIQPSKAPRDIFGATILPQNLSFENTKKLSENQVRLEDIPLVEENEMDEILTAGTMKTSRDKLPKSHSVEEPESIDVALDFGSKVPSRSTLSSKEQSAAELFWIADPYDEIPGPKIFKKFVHHIKQFTRHLTIGSLFRYLKGNAIAPFKVYGPIVKVPEILGGRIVLMSRPEHISAIFEQDHRFPFNSVLDSVERSRLQRHHKSSPVPYILPEDWDEVKKGISEPLMKSWEKYFDGLDDAAESFIRRIKTIRNGQSEVPEDFLFEINKWSLECLCFMIFEKSFGFLDYDSAIAPSKTSQLLYSLTQATKNLCHLETGFQFWRFVNTVSLSSLGSACEVLETVISEYVSQIQMNLLKKKDELTSDYPDSVSIVEALLLQENATPEDVVSTIVENLLIGMNTMSNGLGFLFYHLAMNPRVQAEVWKEVKRILPEKYCRLEYEHLSSFRYIQACLKESLRMKMPMPLLSRILTHNVTVSNYQLPKGTFVLMTAQVECMKEDNFEEPLEFLPERWLEKGVSHPYTSLPLGSYFDDSLQRRLAEMSVWICASLVSRHFTIDYTYGDIEATSTVISFPNKPLKFTFADRKN